MTRRRRTGRAALLLPLGAAVLAAACARPPRTGARIVSEGSLRALPKESVGLLVLEVGSLRRLKATARWMQELSLAADEGPFRQVKDRFGAGLLKDLDRIGLAVVPQPAGPAGWALVAEGAFDEAKVKEALAGQEILTLVESEGKPDLSATALAGGSLALGPRRVLEVVRGNAKNPGAGLDANSKMMLPLAKVEPGTQIWGAVDCRGLAALARDTAHSQGLPDPTQSPAVHAMDALLSVAFQGKVAATVDFSLMGEAAEAAKAKDLADAARSLVALARMGMNQEQARDWLEFLQGIGIDQKGTAIVLRGNVPEKAMDRFAATARSASHQATAGPAPRP